MEKIFETKPYKNEKNFIDKLKSEKDFDEEYPYYGCLCEYENIVAEFGETIIYKIHENYSGDMWFLLNINGKFAYLNLSYGSCSGCDALQGCNSLKDLNYLIIEIYNSMVKFDSSAEALEFFESESRECDAAWYYDENKQFVSEAIEYFKNLA